MPKLILLRHLKSQWNLENRFAGWTDGPLCEEGKKNAGDVAQKLFSFKIDKIYTSPLFRNQDTVVRVLEINNKYPLFVYLDEGKMKKWGNYKDISENDMPVFVSEKLNERYYGELQGKDKNKTMEEYGTEKVRLWRRSFDVPPPGGESLKDTFKRVVPFYRKHVERDLKMGNNVLIVSSHNPLRALVKYIEQISDKDIINVEIPYAGLVEYELDEKLKVKNKRML